MLTLSYPVEFTIFVFFAVLIPDIHSKLHRYSENISQLEVEVVGGEVVAVQGNSSCCATLYSHPALAGEQQQLTEGSSRVQLETVASLTIGHCHRSALLTWWFLIKSTKQ